MAAECCGGDFLEWVGPDNSVSVFGLLDHPADLVRAAAVSRTWRRFVIENDFFLRILSNSLCVRLFPEVATVAAAAEVTRSPPSPPVSQSDSERAYRIYSNLAGALVSSSRKDSVGCVLRCVGASSTDDFPNETMVHTLHERGLVNFCPSYWSSRGADNPDEPESLTYRLNSDICIVDEIKVQPFKGPLPLIEPAWYCNWLSSFMPFFQHGNPIYSSKTVRFQMGHYKLPRGSESFVTHDDENKMVNADKDYMWTYSSPEFPMLQENVLQSFKLPRPVLCIGGVVMIELLGRVQKQGVDDKYYICVCHVEVIGRSLSPLFMVDIWDPGGYSILKYLPGAKNLSAEDMAQYDTKDSLEWQYFGARYRQMNHIAVLNALLMQVHFMHEDDVGWVLQDGLLQ